MCDTGLLGVRDMLPLNMRMAGEPGRPHLLALSLSLSLTRNNKDMNDIIDMDPKVFNACFNHHPLINFVEIDRIYIPHGAFGVGSL